MFVRSFVASRRRVASVSSPAFDAHITDAHIVFTLARRTANAVND